MLLYLLKMWGSVIGLLLFLCWPMYFFATAVPFSNASLGWMITAFSWPTFWMLTAHMAITKDHPGFPCPSPPPFIFPTDKDGE